jgi:hypothetical protein
MAVYINANSSANGQSISRSSFTQVINMTQVTAASQEGLFDKNLSAFIAPTAGMYRVTGGTVIAGGNQQGDGVIFGFSVNQQNPWPPVNPDLSTTNVFVIQPGFFTTGSAQTVNALLQLNVGDTVQFALQGVDNSTFDLSYSYLMVTSV